MNAAARKHDDHDDQHLAAADLLAAATADPVHGDPVHGDPVHSDPESADSAIGNPAGTEYATRGARGHKAARPHLRMVTPLRPERASRGLFALIVTGMLGIGMIVILVINTSLAQGAFTVSELEAERAVLAQQEQALGEELAAAAAPDRLESLARDLGMVPSENPVFLDVTRGKVIGEPKAALGPRTTTPRLLTPADATVTEAVDNGAADLPTSLGPDYDPAAADAATQQAAAAAAAALGAEQAATDRATSEPPTFDPTATAKKATDAKATDAKATDAKKAAKKKKVTENSLWEDATVMDVTGQLSSEDAGLVAVPVE